MPEAKLAREAEICYVSIAMVTDFDCWHPNHENVEVTDIIKTLVANAAAGKEMVKKSRRWLRQSARHVKMDVILPWNMPLSPILI